jgi:endonuclease YncB( thermonuclease family)
MAHAPTVPQTYAALRRAVEDVIIKGQRAAELAKVRTYHETGRLIREHLIVHRGYADYGSKVFRRLAADLDIDRSVLQRCDQFYRAFPMCATWHTLTWAHYRVLIPVEDPKLRRRLANEADRAGWSVVQLEAQVRQVLPLPEPVTIELPGAPARLLTPRRGTPGVCRVIAVEGAPVADLGFAVYRDLGGTSFRVGDFVCVKADGVQPAMDATKADLFTYRAEVLKVVDGDTLWVKVYLLPGHWVKQKLRLRDLDCPELATPEGKAAKRFVETLLAKAGTVTICTTKPDKYDRYLADVFLTTAEPPAGSGQAEEIYLNNELLRHGHAVRKGDYAPADWE